MRLLAVILSSLGILGLAGLRLPKQAAAPNNLLNYLSRYSDPAGLPARLSFTESILTDISLQHLFGA
jgi:hypothetical protein